MQGKRVLIIRVGALGDTLLMIPLIQAIRDYHPGVYIELAGNGEYLSIVRGFPMADKVLSWHQPGLGQLYIPRSSLSPYWQDYFASFDWILAYTQEPILAENLKKAARGLVLFYPPLPFSQEQRHIVTYLLESLKPFGIDSLPLDRPSGIPFYPSPLVHLKEEDVQQAEQFLQEISQIINPGQPIIAIHPGSGSLKKCWPVDSFAWLCLKLNNWLSIKICLIGGPADEQAFNSLKQRLNGLSPILFKDLPLGTLAAFLSHCDLYLGNDSGVTHLAAALGVPTIALFGPTDPRVWAPLGPKVFVLQSKATCSPCNQEKRNNCLEPICMSSISPEHVLKAFLW